ncbi:MAG: SPOR domain-containing protein [Cypionkella sp.]|nr:SPOR domain-containing protein [Cypionkella sp.]
MSAAPVFAQSVAQVGGPAEPPPAGFTGQQFVDSRGCVFMRAGFGGQVNWVPRIGRDRKAVCNEVTPAQAAARLAQGDTGAATANVGAPIATVASAMGRGKKTGVFAPIVVPGLGGQNAGQPVQMPRKIYTPAAPVAAPAVRQPAPAEAYAGGGSGPCPAIAPVLQTLPLSTGGTVAVCTRGDGTATGWVSPSARSIGGTIHDGAGQFAAGQGGVGQVEVGQAGTRFANTAYSGGNGGYAGTGGYVQTVIAGQAVIAPRRDAQTYAPAWDDDRLNPLRGLGTARGWSNQAQVWNNRTPAQTHEDVARSKARKQAAWGVGQARVTASTMSADGAQRVQAAPSGRIYVQVGTFGQAANAQNAAGRLAGMGLPVASAKSVQGGRQLVAIMAGPFGSAAQAQTALGMARSAGFADAYVR